MGANGVCLHRNPRRLVGSRFYRLQQAIGALAGEVRVGAETSLRGGKITASRSKRRTSEPYVAQTSTYLSGHYHRNAAQYCSGGRILIIAVTALQR